MPLPCLSYAFVRAGGLLKIEDILPFFPDFVTIDNFKGAITDSLTRYNRQIDELKAEMDEATEIAGAAWGSSLVYQLQNLHIHRRNCDHLQRVYV